MKIYNSLAIFFILLFSCGKHKLVSQGPPDWFKSLTIYEVMPKHYSPSRNLNGVTRDLNRLRAQFVTALSILPVMKVQDVGNNYNPGDPYATVDYLSIDTSLGTEKDFKLLIDSAHLKKMKVFLEMNLTYSGPAHAWRKDHPEFYLSSEEKSGMDYNKDFVRFDLNNNSLRKKLAKAVKHWCKKYDVDGIMLVHSADIPKEFALKLSDIVRGEGKVLIGGSQAAEWVNEGIYDAYLNQNLYQVFDKISKSECRTSDFKPILEENAKSKYKSVSILFNQNAITNIKFGGETQRCYGCYKLCSVITYMLGGIPLMLNGQEEPMFEPINIRTEKTIEHVYNYNRDFYRGLALHRFDHPALHSLTDNLPEIISDSEEVLSIERKQGNTSIVLMANLTDTTQTYSIRKDYNYYTEFFTRALVSFPKNTTLTLGPYQYLVLTNIK